MAINHHLTRRTLLLGAGLLLPRKLLAAPTSLAIIVRSGSPISDISRADLRRLFSGESIRIAGQTTIALNMPPGSAERIKFDRMVLGMEPDDITKFWIDQRIRGQGRPPRIGPSATILVRLVAALPNALSYAPRGMVAPGVKAVRIDGKSADDKDYLLG